MISGQIGKTLPAHMPPALASHRRRQATRLSEAATCTGMPSMSGKRKEKRKKEYRLACRKTFVMDMSSLPSYSAIAGTEMPTFTGMTIPETAIRQENCRRLPDGKRHSHIERPAIDGQRRFLHRFGKRRMSVTDTGDVFGRCPEGSRHDKKLSNSLQLG